MSKHHSRLVQIYNNTEASGDRIWSVAENVWKTCSSVTISRALFVHAYRVMKRIIAEDGNNAWLAVPDGTSHCDDRKDFYDTDTGIKPRTKHEPSDTIQVSRTVIIYILPHLKWSLILDPAFPTNKLKF
jgi:hypothetical protein